MNRKLKIYAMIPARYGSSRLKLKNLALINGKPMISYAINAAKESKIFDRIIVNSEHLIFSEIANRYGVEFYLRPEELGSSKAKSDSVVADFMAKFPEADIVVWVNPIAPFQTGDAINKVVKYFLDERCDSLITVEDKQVHCLCDNVPVNYDKEGLFAQTQELEPVQAFVYSIMMWRKDVFLKELREKGHALFCGEFGVYAVDKDSALIIKTKEDINLADMYMQAKANRSSFTVLYDEVVDKYEK